MLATGRSLSLVSALVALALFAIMETSVVSSSPAYLSDAQLKGEADGGEVQGYGDDIVYSEGDPDLGGEPEKDVGGDCHTGSLLFQRHNLNLDVFRSSSIETNFQLSIDESSCIACVVVQPRRRIKSNVVIQTTNGSSANRNTVTVTVIGASCQYYERVPLVVKIFTVRKRGNYCDPI